MYQRRTGFSLCLAVLLLSGLIRGNAFAAQSDISLSGEQDGAYESGAYSVEDGILVQPGKTMKLAAGSVLRFQRYGTITVLGTLICEGSPTDPVVFTSWNDQPGTDGPAPFSWNGIVVKNSGELHMKYTRISYSTYGIDAESGAVVALNDVAFAKNGRTNFSVDGVVMDVEESRPYSYASSKTALAESSSAAGKEDALDAAQEKSTRGIALPLRICFGICAATGVVIAAQGYWASEHYYDKYDASRDAASVSPDDIDDYQRKSEAGRTRGIVGAVIAGIGAIGFGVTFAF